MPPSIYDYIITEESAFETEEIRVGHNWMWNFRTHVQMIFHLKNGQFYSGDNNWLRAFKNVMEPILNLAYWTEDLEVKDVVFYIENKAGRILSFLIKRYHDDVYAKEHNLDMLFDEITESDLDFGGALVQMGKEPEVLPLTTIAFCDQSDLLGGPLGFKMSFSPSKLRSMSARGWGEESNGATISIEELIMLAQATKDPVGATSTNRSTGKNIDVYIVRGNLPEHYLLDNDDMEYHCEQVQVVAFYADKDGKKQGNVLYRKKEKEGRLKFHTCKKVPGRALGRGQGEALLHPQIWTNFLTIHKTNMLEAGSKVLPWTDDDTFSTRNTLRDKENLEISTVAEGRQLGLLPTVNPAAFQMFDKGVEEWYNHAQLSGAAFDPIMGETPTSGTTFRGQERTVAQGRGLHDRRRGQRAKFIEEIYREAIIPQMVKEILNGKEFLATLTADEMQWVSDQLAENYANRKMLDAVLDGELPGDKDELKKEFLENFSKKGNKHLLKILKDEFRDVEIKMGVNVAGKQKNLANLSDKLLSVFQFIIADPMKFQQAMQNPALAKMFGDILEYSGLSMADFQALMVAPPQVPQALPAGAPQAPAPIQVNPPVPA